MGDDTRIIRQDLDALKGAVQDLGKVMLNVRSAVEEIRRNLLDSGGSQPTPGNQLSLLNLKIDNIEKKLDIEHDLFQDLVRYNTRSLSFRP
jgi:hypothetical protein